MANTDEVTDSPTRWVAEHARRYLESEGSDGHLWRGVPTLLLTTRGRTSGRARRTPLIYGRDGDRYLLVASRGGHPRHPDWYLNLLATPEVGVQVGAERFTARATTADAGDKPRLWRVMTDIWPDYDQYQAKTTREIPVVILDRV